MGLDMFRVIVLFLLLFMGIAHVFHIHDIVNNGERIEILENAGE